MAYKAKDLLFPYDPFKSHIVALYVIMKIIKHTKVLGVAFVGTKECLAKGSYTQRKIGLCGFLEKTGGLLKSKWAFNGLLG